MNAEEYIGRVARARENLTMAQKYVGLAAQSLLDRPAPGTPQWASADRQACARRDVGSIDLALDRIELAAADLKTVRENLELQSHG